MVIIKKKLIEEAKEYSKLSKFFTSNKHDFHEGGLDAKEKKMFEGKLGEKGIKQFFLESNIKFKEDDSSYRVADDYDFVIFSDSKKYLVDVKTRTQKHHFKTLEMVKQLNIKKINLYISVKLSTETQNYKIEIVGWCTKEDIIKINRIENLGYLDNYVMHDKELRNINTLKTYLSYNSLSVENEYQPVLF